MVFPKSLKFMNSGSEQKGSQQENHRWGTPTHPASRHLRPGPARAGRRAWEPRGPEARGPGLAAVTKKRPPFGDGSKLRDCRFLCLFPFDRVQFRGSSLFLTHARFPNQSSSQLRKAPSSANSDTGPPAQRLATTVWQMSLGCRLAKKMVT